MNYYALRKGNVFQYLGKIAKHGKKLVRITEIRTHHDETLIYDLETFEGESFVSYQRDSELREILLSDEILEKVGFKPYKGGFFKYNDLHLFRNLILSPEERFYGFIGGVILYYIKMKEFPEKFESLEQVFEYAKPIHHVHALQNWMETEKMVTDFSVLADYKITNSVF